MLALAAWLAAAPALADSGGEPQQSGGEPRVTIALLPRGVSIGALAEQAEDLALGFYNPGLSRGPGPQTYLDIGQGNRLHTSLYPFELPLLLVREDGVPRPAWRAVSERARRAPATLTPGLLGDLLGDRGVEVGAMPGTGSGALIAARSDGAIASRAGCRLGRCPGLTVATVGTERLSSLIAGLRGDDMLIALERAPTLRRLAAIGIAGDSFSGEPRSATTRIDGYVLSTDIAPTILARYGVARPSQMSGRPISAGGEADAAGLARLADRLIEITPRRHPVLGVNLLVWIGIAVAGLAALRGAWARIALPALAVTLVWAPLLATLVAATYPSVLAERLVVGIGAPALALLSLLALRGRFGPRAPFAAFALAAFATVTAIAVDVVAGSALTSISVLGPNPALGVRFFGIGNELEAVIGVLLPLGAGAAVAALRPADPARAVAILAAAVTAVAVLVYAPGSWGADVGAAIVFPAGAAAVALAALGATRRRVAVLVGAPVAGLLALVAFDVALGADAHLSRSVLEAGGFDELGQVLERRTRLAARSFNRFGDSYFFMAALILIAVAVIFRRAILGWFEQLPAARAGLIGAVAVGLVGTVANDSGALLLVIATLYASAYVAVGWTVQYFSSDS